MSNENLNEMTEQELEAATNPFANLVDSNGDGEISPEELDAAVDNLAELEESQDSKESEQLPDASEEVSSDPIPDTEKTAAEMVREAEAATHVNLPNVANENVEAEAKVIEEVDTTGMPTKKILAYLMPPSSDDANLTHTVEWARHCNKWAQDNSHHFLGFGKGGEPVFKEIE